MPNTKRAPDDLTMRMETEDDVEGHSAKFKGPDGVSHKKRAVEDDDVEGHKAHRSAPGDLVKATEDDVEGHMIGAMNPIMARELARAKERDIQRSTSRGNLISEAKRAIRHKE